MPDEALLAKARCFAGDKSALVLAESFLLQVAMSRRLADKAEGLLFMDSFKVRSQGHPCMRCRQTQHACSESGISALLQRCLGPPALAHLLYTEELQCAALSMSWRLPVRVMPHM